MERTEGRTRVSHTDDILDAPGDELVCHCSGVTKNRIVEAIRAGARTLAAIKGATGACAIARCQELNPRGR
jgi:NAD(P)H-nitrite reductase large subunit